MAAPDREKDLIIGLLAMHLGLVDRKELLSTARSWNSEQARTLTEALVRSGRLDPEEMRVIDRLAQRHLEKNQGDIRKAIGSLTTTEELDHALSATLDHGPAKTIAHPSSSAIETNPTAGDQECATTSPLDSRFRVLRPHAQGGLGAVFLAHDQELNREVALKRILEQHADKPESRQRFRIEAEVTGGLEHPGIVPVYGMGTYADGRPYYAMRFIQGDSLRQAIERYHLLSPEHRSLELRKLLRRFLEVCNAIHYAHSRGVLHRDIKPGNIIVGKYGETLVVDWGLAKATGKTEPSADERTLIPAGSSGSSETQPGSALGTPAYMSPEQALGDLARMSPRSDVYGLGATLYHLLLGRPPVENSEVNRVIQSVIRGEIKPLRQADPTIDPALEAICSTAMALEPENRYASARALADDIERWMADEPVTAYRDGFARRLGRWGRRHATPVAGIGALLTTAVIALSVSTWLISRKNDRIERASLDLEEGNRRIASQRDRADRAREEADEQAKRAELGSSMARQAIRKMLDEVARNDLLGIPQAEPLRMSLAERALAFCRELDQLSRNDPTIRLELARIEEEVASLYRMMGKFDRAEPEYVKAIGILRALIDGDPRDPRFPEHLAHTESQLGELIRQWGRPTTEAEPHYRESVRLAADLRQRHPSNARFVSLAARTHNDLADMLAAEERFDEAEPFAGVAAAAARDHRNLLPSQPDPKRFDMDWTILPLVLTTHGEILSRMRRDQDAKAVVEQLVAELQTLLKAYPENNDLQWLDADAHKNLALILGRDPARIQEGIALLNQADAAVGRLITQYPSVDFYPKYQITLRFERGGLHLESGRLDDAKVDLTDAETRLAKALEKEKDAVTLTRQLGDVKARLARIAVSRGRIAEARELVSSAVAHAERAAALDPGNKAVIRRLEEHRALARELTAGAFKADSATVKFPARP